jgi:hypothetical protein
MRGAGMKFVGQAEEDRAAVRPIVVMACSHDGFHGICTSYDRKRGVLVYFWTCERCGARLHEARREEYRPSFVLAARPAFSRPGRTQAS